MRKTKIFIWYVLVAIVLASTALFYFGSQNYVFTITQGQINEALQARFPVSKFYLKFFQVTYSDPKASFSSQSNHIEISLDIELEINTQKETKKYTGNVVMTTGLGYRYETKQFYLSNPEVKQLTIRGI